jgi:hypothetical protein
MTGVGQRMPSQQAIILRPGQQTGLVTLPTATVGQAVRQPVLVNATAAGSIRVQGPGLQTRPAGVAANRNVLINQSGSQFTVPLASLQSMQAGNVFDYPRYLTQMKFLK